jgi:hypothetical protein
MTVVADSGAFFLKRQKEERKGNFPELEIKYVERLVG